MGRVGAGTLRRKTGGRRALALVAVFALVATLVVARLQTAAHAVAPSTTELISKTSANLVPANTANKQGPNPSDSPSQSADGVWTAFVSANNLDPKTPQNPGGNPDINDLTNARDQIYVRNRITGATTWVSNVVTDVCFDGSAVLTCDAFQPSISADGRFVAFTARFSGSFTQALEQCGPNQPGCEVYVADLHSPTRPITASLVSTRDGTTPAAGTNDQPAISGDGSQVAFVSTAVLEQSDPASVGIPEVFVHVMASGANRLISSDLNGNRANLLVCRACRFTGASQPTISTNGRFVGFTSDEPLVHEWTNDFNRFPLNLVYVRDRDAAATDTFDEGAVTTRLVSKDAFGQLPMCSGEGTFVCAATSPSISGDGAKVAFQSQAFNLGGPTNNFVSQVFVHDRTADANVNLVSVSWPSSGPWLFGFDRPIALHKGTPGSAFQLILSDGTVEKGLSAVLDSSDPTVVDVNPPSFGLTPPVVIARGVVVPHAISTLPLSIATDNALETAIFRGNANQGSTTVGLNLLSVSPTPTGVRFTFDDQGVQPNTVINPNVPLRIFDAKGAETSATSESVMPSTPSANQVSVDATFPAAALASAVGVSVPAGAISNPSKAPPVVNRDDEMLAPVRPINVVASVDSNRNEGSADSSAPIFTSDGRLDRSGPSISSDGRTLAFASVAQNLDGKSAADQCSDGNPPAGDVYSHDLAVRTTHRVSVSTNDQLGTCSSDQPSVSANGRYIAFHSFASNLSPVKDTNGTSGDVFLRDRAPALSITPSPQDFGVVAIGSSSAQVVFTVTNNGEGPAVLSPSTLTGTNPTNFQIVNDSCGTPPGRALFPGDPGCTITIIFTPFTPPAPGPRSADINVNSVNGGVPEKPVLDHLTGTAGPANLVLTPSPENFGNVLVSSSLTAVLTLTNTGGAPATVTSLPISGTNGGDFSVVSTNCLIAAIPAGGSCSITVKFAPTAVGTRSANLSVTSNANPVIDPLSGTGIQAAITLSPVPDDFGFVPLTTSVTSTVTATNTGTAPASISTVVVSGSSEFAITIDGCTGKTLAPGASCQIVLRFAPTATGDRTAILTVIDTAPGSPHLDPLTGRGVRLQVLPNIGAPSDVANVIGDGWRPNTQVLVNWDPGLGSQTVKSDNTGHFSVLMLLFRHDNIGPRKVKANDGTTIIKLPFLAVPGSSGPPGWILRR